MADTLLAMHKAFLAEVHKQRDVLHSQLRELESVEAYHQRMIDTLSKSNAGPESGEMPAERQEAPEISDPRLIGATKHDACQVALNDLGGRAKTMEIAQWLTDKGYGAGMSPRVLHNSCFTAMCRRRDMFRKVGAGEWELMDNGSDTENGLTVHGGSS